MAWQAIKQRLLDELVARIDARAAAADRASLQQLSAALYGRLPAEDMRDRSVENLYGCLVSMLRFMRAWDRQRPAVRIFNATLAVDGWESHRTHVVLLCRAMPFCMASVRGELNRRNLTIHSLVSADLGVRRDAAGQLIEILSTGELDPGGESGEALLLFEIDREAQPGALGELADTLVTILEEVALVVGDFHAMQQRLAAAAGMVTASACVTRAWRDEALAFLNWLQSDHMTFLGYEYLAVSPPGDARGVRVVPGESLGLLRLRSTRGVQDLAADLATLSQDELLRKQLSFSKSRERSRVHRAAYPDYIEVREYDGEGRVIGQHRFLGLYTSAVYSMDPRDIPVLRRKIQRVLELSAQQWSEHEMRELLRVLQVFPRDELFQSSIGELQATANAVNRIQERKQTRVFIRSDAHGKFVNCVIYLPREQYHTALRLRIESILGETFAADDMEFNTFYSESILVRVHFVLRVDPAAPLDYDVNEIQAQIEQAMLSWEDRLQARLYEEFGDEEGERIFRKLGRGFPPGYRDDFDPRLAVQDIVRILEVDGGAPLALTLFEARAAEDGGMCLRLYCRGSSLSLSAVLPILENLGLHTLTERPYRIHADSGEPFWVQEFRLVYSLAGDVAVAEVGDEFEDAFARIWFGEAENDSFNRLLLGSRLNWREIALLRAYARYLRQVLFPYSVEYMAETLGHHLQITGSVVELFLTRFSPVFEGDDAWRAEREQAVEARILEALEEVPNLGEDRIIRQYVHAVKATLRTNFFQPDGDGRPKSYFSLKLCPGDIPEVPRPVPLYEIYVYSPRVEGVHLRAGKVARGGLRWSDRLEDFRTEVLGLVKAQQVKNAVIVPVGAKGGFVARQLTADMTRAEEQDEVEACYRMFIRGLLDLTDNRVEGGVRRPTHVIARDDEDPYLVVAADKGTATFSDMANRIADEYGFWLGDAFASGGSAGYDHKAMAITARGAWVSVLRHFREMGVDIQRTDFSVVGIGDMSGDVFGNGMLLSPHICLVAAFNHRHIFIDPAPDPLSSYAERKRLFELPRSSWADYDAALLSAGGGVFDRAAKSILLSPQIRERFGIARERLTPVELISHLLRAPVDLLWNGGIGTYVKASVETPMDVGDKSNDALRIDASELRCRVIGEGGNLGMTQLARVEYSLAGGRCNTDFVDNAAGVDCSDHEVNIKILLNAVVERGDLTPKQRNALLAEMAGNVAELVLRNNYDQTRAISLAEQQAEARHGEYQRFMRSFEEAGRLDRALEFLPTDEQLMERRAQGQTLTRPELAILISYNKAALKEQLLEAGLDGDPWLARVVASAFPDELVTRYREDIHEHRLYREILATQLANDIVNRMGLNFVLRQRRATGASVADVACAYTAVLEIFALPELWLAIELLDYRVEARVQTQMMLDLIRLVKRATRWLLRNRRRELTPEGLISRFGPGVATLRDAFGELAGGRVARERETLLALYTDAGVPADLAARVAGTRHAHTALGIIQGACDAGARLQDVARLYFLLGERLELDWLAGQILAARVDSEWHALARDTYLGDLEWQQRTLAIAVLSCSEGGDGPPEWLARWEQREAVLLARWHQMLTELHAVEAPDFPMLAVANRELLDLAQSSQHA